MVAAYAGLPLRTALSSAFMSVVRHNCGGRRGRGGRRGQGR